MKRTFMDEDMIGNVSRHPRMANHHHVAKRRQRNKALEVVFDPTSHKEYITGFRKRKQQRRKEALSALEKRQRQQRLEERAEVKGEGTNPPSDEMFCGRKLTNVQLCSSVSCRDDSRFGNSSNWTSMETLLTKSQRWQKVQLQPIQMFKFFLTPTE